MSDATDRYARPAFDFRISTAALRWRLKRGHRRTLQCNLFVGQSRGRINGFDYVHGFNYILGYYYWIRFVGNQARMACKPINPQFPGGDENSVFYRIRS